MKPIVKEEKKDTILTNEITHEHIVVAVIDGKPAILSGHEYDQEHTKFLGLDVITNGSYFGSTYGSIKEAVNTYINFNHKIEVFRGEDWKEAMQWLIDNAK